MRQLLFWSPSTSCFTTFSALCYFTFCKFITLALAFGLSFKSTKQSVSSGLQDSSQCSSRSRWCFRLNGQDSFFNFQLFKSPFKSFGGRFQANQLHLVSPLPSYSTVLKSFFGKIQILVNLFTFFYFSLLSSLLFTSLRVFTLASADGHSLDSKSPQVSRTLLYIFADLNNAIVFVVSTCPLFSKSSIPFTNPLETVPRAPITVNITVTNMFQSFFIFLARSTCLSLFSLSFIFALWLAKSTLRQVLFIYFFFFFLYITRYVRLAETKWSVCIAKS